MQFCFSCSLLHYNKGLQIIRKGGGVFTKSFRESTSVTLNQIFP